MRYLVKSGISGWKAVYLNYILTSRLFEEDHSYSLNTDLIALRCLFTWRPLIISSGDKCTLLIIMNLITYADGLYS